MEGSISLRGSEGVQIYLNGRRAPMDGQSLTSFLQGLNASDVKQIEVVPNPSAAFDPEGTSGIINIVLEEDTDRGWGGGVSASVSTDESYNGSINAHLGEDGSVELGYESEIEHERNEYFSESLVPGSGRMTPDDSLNNTFAYGRDLHSLFGTASTKFGSFNLQLGLRAERALRDLDQKTLDEQFENAYFSVFPSVHLTYEASQSQNFNVSYSKRVRRQTNASNIQSSLSNDALGFMTRLRLTATIVEGLQLQFSQFYRSGHDIAGGSIGAFTRTNVALRQRLFGEKASLSIRGSDLLGDSSFNVTRNTDRFYQEFSRTRDSRQVQISFRYKFGQQDERRRGQEGPPEGGDGGGEGGAYGGGM